MFKLIIRSYYFVERNISRVIYLLRDRRGVLSLQNNRADITLNRYELGGGETPRLRNIGFKNIDLRNLETVDVINTTGALQKENFPAGIDYLYTRHMLEHLAEYEIEKMFKSWRDVLNPGAIIEILVPNTRFHVFQYLASKHGTDSYRHALAGFNGWQRCEHQDYWDVHKYSFDEVLLQKKLSEYFSFDKYYFVHSAPKHLHFIGRLAP